MTRWENDDELFNIMRKELFTALVGDIMDKMNLFQQFLSPKIQPLKQEMVVIGRAMPVLVANVNHENSTHNPILSKPFGLMLEALDGLKKNEVYVCGGASPNYALWGELMSTRAIKLGASGAVLDGYSRDTFGILNLGFPTFSYGHYAQDQLPRGKVIDFRIPIEISGVMVRPGDMVMGDIDGVCIIPAAIEEEVIVRALEKGREENIVKKKIQEGMGAKEAFEAYGIM